MTYQPVYINNSLFTERQTYVFEVLSQMELAPSEGYFVLRDPLGYKMLMPSGFYLHYGFETGQKIQCRVDKVNCNGRIFLEPQNPWYSEGQTYDFDVVSSGLRKSFSGEIERYFTVRDINSTIWKVKIPELVSGTFVHDRVTCMVERIKKGILHLRVKDHFTGQSCFTKGFEYKMILAEEKLNPDDGIVYYILKDEWGKYHPIKKKYYLHYRLKKGSEVRCRADGININGEVFLEPEHPVYQPGCEYILPVNRFEEYIFSDGTRQKWIVLKDHFHEDLKVKVPDETAMNWTQYKKLKCRILTIRKSRLEVALVCGVE